MSLLIALFMVGEPGEVLFVFGFESAIFIDFEVEIVGGVQQILAGFYVITTIGEPNTNIYAECCWRFVLSTDFATWSPSL